MIGTKMTLEEAARKWVGSFNSIPYGVVCKLLEYSCDELVEITPTNIDNFDDFLPIWGSLWSFDNGADIAWLEDEKNLKAMADCGFRIYEHEDYGYIFGIDGAGYDFFEAHWIPLYKARGLQWHL